MIFQDDSAPCHRCKIVKEYLEENQIKTLDWPGNSPDLNPIENIWAILKQKVGRNSIPNKNILENRILEAWNNKINQKTIKEIIGSMPKRIKSCIKNKGYSTKY